MTTAPAEPNANLVAMGDRLKPIISERDAEREAAAEEAAQIERELEDYDETKLEHRARAINGALNTFDFVPITGREYWQVYGREPARSSFIKWARKAQASINDIVAQHDRQFAGGAK